MTSSPPNQGAGAATAAPALALAARGWPVFPVNGKAPYTANGLHDATTDKATVERWWSRIWPKANVGVRTGEGLLVLDVDGEAGADALHALQREHGELPATVEVLTARGRHLYFTSDEPIRNSAGKLGPGLDVRGDGGYIVAPPSVHESGHRYEWSVDGHPDEVALAELPPWLLARLRDEQRNGSTPPVVAGSIPAGKRNDELARLAGAMRRKGMGSEELAAALRVTNAQRCHPPLEEKEVAAIAESVARYEPESDDGAKLSQATRLVALATAEAELFHSEDRTAFASLAVDGHRETWPLRSKRVRTWLARAYYQDQGRTPGAQALQDALGVLEGEAVFAGAQEPVSIRVAEHETRIYLDLADEQWTHVAIDRDGWRVDPAAEVRMRRPGAMAALPVPERGGTIDLLRPFVNVAGEHEWRLVVAWLIAALRPSGPYPVLTLHGEHGSAKTTLARVLRALVDPSATPVRADPREPRDLMIGASNGWVLALDNLSRMQPWLSDGLCRLATGGGFAVRELYSDSDEVILEAQRPVILTGIEELATRGDLLDRALILYLPTIDKAERRTEREFWTEFERVRPRILGALLGAVSTALRNLDAVELAEPPRMADFAEWVVAAEPALGWEPGGFITAYTANRAVANELTLEVSPLAGPVRELAAAGFEGTASELLERLGELAGETATRRKSWPSSPPALGAELRRIAPNLRAADVVVEFQRERGRRSIRIKAGIAVTPVTAVTTRNLEPDPRDSGDGKRDSRDSGGDSRDSAGDSGFPLCDARDSDDSDSRTHSLPTAAEPAP